MENYLVERKVEIEDIGPELELEFKQNEDQIGNKKSPIEIQDVHIQEQNEDISSCSTPSTPINAPVQFSDPKFIHTTPLPLAPLRVEKNDGWSCGRCTLINFKNQ